MPSSPVPLAAEDRAILALEDATVVGHTCHVVVLGAPRLDAAGVRARIAARLGAAPELRYRLAGSAVAPVWVPVDDVDLGGSVVDVDVDPVDADRLRAVVARRFADHLDRRRPLWAIDVVPLADGGTALVWRLHHALADGTTAVRLATTVLFDALPGGVAPAGRAGDPAAPGAPATTAAVIGHAARRADHVRRRAHLAGLLEREFATAPGHSPFDGRIGVRRDVAFAATHVSALRAAAHAACGATVNDALLSLVAGAVRRWLVRLDARVGDLRVRVPVSLHHDGDTTSNRDAWFDLPLPVHVEDPVHRLQLVHHATTVRKTAHDAERLEHFVGRMSEVAPALAHLVQRLEAGPHAFAVSVSNVRGPDHDVTVLGRPVTNVLPVVEIGRRHAVRVGAMSTGDRLDVGFCADPDVVPGVDVLADGVAREADLLLAAAGP